MTWQSFFPVPSPTPHRLFTFPWTRLHTNLPPRSFPYSPSSILVKPIPGNSVRNAFLSCFPCSIGKNGCESITRKTYHITTHSIIFSSIFLDFAYAISFPPRSVPTANEECVFSWNKRMRVSKLNAKKNATKQQNKRTTKRTHSSVRPQKRGWVEITRAFGDTVHISCLLCSIWFFSYSLRGSDYFTSLLYISIWVYVTWVFFLPLIRF